MKNRVVVILTACVNPDGMSYTKLQDVEIRKQQYINALHFYLKKTNLPIVFVENTNTDISGEFQDFIHNGRLEYLMFDGNNFDKMRGKGYGEALILIHAIENSKFIKQGKYILKITGRIIVRNVEYLSKSRILFFNHVFRCNLAENQNIDTISFICRPNDLYIFLQKHIEEITEQPRGFYLERIVYKGFANDKDLQMYIIPFFVPPVLDGFSATHGVKYTYKLCRYNRSDNLYYLSLLEKERKTFLKYFVVKLLYKISLMLNKFGV